MRRFTTLLLGCWLSLLTADLPSLHACTMHAGGGHGAPVAAPAGAEDHAAHATHGAAAEGARTAAETDAPRHADACQCLGECCASTVAPLAPAFDRPLVLALPSAERAEESHDAAPRRASDLRLPFANGPPGLLTA